jgi:hypothetical protein
MAPTGHKPEYLRQCFDVLSADPPIVRWRTRPLVHFASEAAWTAGNKNNAGQTIKPQADGRLRVKIDGRHVDVRAIVAEIGVTPVEDRDVGPAGGGGPDGPHDRLAATRKLAGTGPLAEIMQDAREITGRTIGELTVLGENDPYRIDTAANRRDAIWFARQVLRFVVAGRRIHVRGVFYACVAAPAIKPDGTAFQNNAQHEKDLGEWARFARWLDYVDFERLVDNKNDEPVVREAPEEHAPNPAPLAIGLKVDGLDGDSLAIQADLAGFPVRQPYRLAFFGEKTSLEDVAGPLAEEFGADLYLCSGQISDTLLYRMMSDADADGRPLIVFTLSDCDPAGYWDMPTSIGRKLQALRDLKFHLVEFTVVHAALSPKQARTLDLPSSPLKDGEKRGPLWLQTYGLEQTEIDALATLRPDVLERMIREAVAPYFDAGLAARVRAAREAWEEHAQEEIDAHLGQEALDALKARSRAAIEELELVNAEIEAMRDGVPEIEEAVPDLPEADMAALERAQRRRRDAVLIDSDMDFVEATLKGAQRACRPARCGQAGALGGWGGEAVGGKSLARQGKR